MCGTFSVRIAAIRRSGLDSIRRSTIVCYAPLLSRMRGVSRVSNRTVLQYIAGLSNSFYYGSD